MNLNGQVEVKRKIINNEDMFEGTIPFDKVIGVLKSALLRFSLSGDVKEQKVAIEKFYREVDKWQIILLSPQENNKIWLQVPISYYETVTKFSFVDRVKFLIGSGVLLDSETTSKYADIISNVKFPMEVSLEHSEEVSFKHESKEEISDYYSLSREEVFHYSILQVTENIVNLMKDISHNKIAVYERPYGVVAMNRTNYHLAALERDTGINAGPLRKSIEVVDFSSLINSAEIHFNNQVD